MFNLVTIKLSLLCRSANSFKIAALESVFLVIFLSIAQQAMAQIVPDNTLPQNSIVRNNAITGGTTSGSTLFHSFQDFSIPTGSGVVVVPEAQIQNIIMRVTGQQRSSIDGLLAVNGTANLFLLNPKGISFGQNAQLAIGGSFFATTAESVTFSDGSEFSTKTPQAPPLLTISTPIGLQFGTRPDSIIVQSRANQLGLLVPPGQTLALIGGDILVDGGNLTASSGKVVLSSVTTPEFVSLTHSNDAVGTLGTIQLSNDARIDASGLGGGRIELQGGTITLSNARIVSLTLGDRDGEGISIRADQVQLQDGAQILSLTTNSGKGGDIELSAERSIDIWGVGIDRYQQLQAQLVQSGAVALLDPAIALNTSTTGTGRAGNVLISTDQLRFGNGSIFGSTTTQSGQGGTVSLRATDVSLVGAALFNGTLRGSTGAAGDIEIQADRLTLRESAVLTTSAFGEGNSGRITLNIKDSIAVADSLSGSVIQTAIASNSLGGNQGRGGDITINTGRLTVSGGAGISLSSSGFVGGIRVSSTGGQGGDLKIQATEAIDVSGISGVLANGTSIYSYLATETSTLSPGGNIVISTPVLSIRDGALISTGSLGLNRAGNITIEADRVELSGQAGQYTSKIEASAGNFLTSSTINLAATADAGDLNLNVRELLIRDGATVTVQNTGAGKAGNINVIGNAITLDNRASIDARTGTAGGGNVNLRSQTIRLRRGSQIQTDANRSNGGNIDIRTGFLLAVPAEDSDITANATTGRGGNININAQGIFGLQQSESRTPRSDITASSSFGLDGIVKLNTLINKPAIVTELPATVIDSPSQIAQTCARSSKTGEFIITERGGLAPSVSESVQSTPIWVDQRGRTTAGNRSELETIAEATEWIQQSNGTIALVAETSSDSPGSITCQKSGVQQ